MTTEKVEQTVVTEGPTTTEGPGPTQAAAAQGQAPSVAPQQTVRTDYQSTSTSPGTSEMIRRVIVFVFGLIQLVIGLRIVLLLLDARTGNASRLGILDVSKVFVGPFEGILNTNALTSGGSIARRRRGRRVRRLDGHRADRDLGSRHLPALVGLTRR